MTKPQIGMIGLGVMGQNLVLNMLDHGFSVAVYNRSLEKTKKFQQKVEEMGGEVVPSYSLREIVSHLKGPRVLFLMVKAGKAVDDVLDLLEGLLAPKDIVIDGGNSHYADTERRVEQLGLKGVYFVGAGISGGEMGARHGPSIMPGGDRRAWPTIAPILEAISAKVDGEPCCRWIGPGGAGHYVKMVHNGIEYGDMQLIVEAYDLMRRGMGLEPDEISEVLSTWGKGELDSYLIQITAKILSVRDSDGAFLIDKIVDVSGEKGTGRWTVEDALEKSVPLTLTGEAVFARYLSRLKELRRAADKRFAHLYSPKRGVGARGTRLVEDLRDALYCSRIISYCQGLMLLQVADERYGWGLDLGSIASIWRGGCIIRSKLLDSIRDAYERDKGLRALVMDDFFVDAISKRIQGWRRTIARAFSWGVPIPAMAASLTFFDGLSSRVLPANLIQAMRDYFGAHTYERVDRPGQGPFHTQWAEKEVEG